MHDLVAASFRDFVDLEHIFRDRNRNTRKHVSKSDGDFINTRRMRQAIRETYRHGRPPYKSLSARRAILQPRRFFSVTPVESETGGARTRPTATFMRS